MTTLSSKVLPLAILAAAIASCGQIPVTVDSPIFTADPSIASLHIVYFVDPQTSGLLSPQTLQGALGVDLAESWQDVISANEAHGLDALIIDESVVSTIDADQLTRIYDNGTTVAFFNVLSQTVEELVNDPSIGRDNWMDGTAEPMAGDFYIIVEHLLLCKNGEIASSEGGELCPGSLLSSVSGSKAAESLNNNSDLEFFIRVLETYLNH